MNAPSVWIVSAVLIGGGVGVGGYFIGHGISHRNDSEGTISVKGLSERDVPASIAIWSISFQEVGNSLPEINSALEKSTTTVVAFLKERGFEETELTVQPPAVRDHSFDTREEGEILPENRFSAHQSVLLRTTKVDQIKPSLGATSKLMQEGVFLSSGGKPNYIYNQINEIKPGMIEEATRNASIAGGQFARDSGIKLGKLMNASQGWFQVDDRDAATPEIKTVRVVVDVVYGVE